MKRILVVEDEYAIRELVALNLQMAGYEVVGAESAEQALEIFSDPSRHFDLAILDIMLPGMSGLELCSILRQENSTIGIIILSAKTQELDKIEGLSLGADDYVTKPFSVGELLARMEAIFRRAKGPVVADSEPEITLGVFTLNRKSRSVKKGDKLLDLTQVELQLMELFFENPGTALDRERILKTVWGKNYVGDVKIVDVNICRLRMKIEEEANAPQHIVTVWGYGYRWNL